MKRLLYLGVALFLILFEAIPEGLALGGHKTLAGVFEFVFLAGITLAVFAFFTNQMPLRNKHGLGIIYDLNYWWIIAGYVLLRFALFDYAHNLSAGLPLFYVGDTKIYDQIWQWWFNWTGVAIGHFLAMFKLIALLIGGTWLITK